VHFRFAPVPSPAAARIQHDIGEWIEPESTQRLMAKCVSAVFQVAMPEVKDTAVDKAHASAHGAAKRFGPNQVMLDLASAHSDRVHPVIEDAHRSAQNRPVAGSENARVVERRLAYEAADCGLLSSDLAAGIRRVKGVKKLGMRLGNWLTAEQGHALWQAPDRQRLKGKRDRALLALLLVG